MAAHRKVKIPWAYKAIAFQLFDRMPYGEKVYYLFQRYFTHTHPRPLSPTAASGKVQIEHAKAILALRQDITTLKLLELGSGWDLYANLIYYCYGIEHQTAVDVRRWARAETVNAVIAHLQKDPPSDCKRVPTTLVRDGHLDEDLLALYGIRYLAPFDGTQMSLADASIDLVTTTSVFEHIPADICRGILRECRRVLRDEGFMRHVIDYSDHYNHADPAITDYNYLAFSERQWRRYSPGIHYQNRLRSRDFEKMFAEAGFIVMEKQEWRGLPAELQSVTIHKDFDRYSRDELAVIGAVFLLKPI
jgi:predicted SAM-dependent methyltransferase